MNRLLIAVLIVVSSSLLFSCKEPDTVSGVGGDSGGHAHPAAPPIAPPATPVDVQPVDSGITLISPNGGENWNVGETHTITWSSGSGGTLYIYLYKGGDYSETIASSTANDGSFNWTIPSSLATSSNYGIVIFSTENSDVYDLSNGDFTITNPVPTITVTSPNGGEAWVHGENRTFTWDSNNLGGSVKIDLYKSGSYDGTVTESTPNDGSFDWTILSSVTAGSNYKARVTSTTYSSVFDSSNSNFTVEGATSSAPTVSLPTVSLSCTPVYSPVTNNSASQDYYRDVQVPSGLVEEGGGAIEGGSATCHLSFSSLINWQTTSVTVTYSGTATLGSDYTLRRYNSQYGSESTIFGGNTSTHKIPYYINPISWWIDAISDGVSEADETIVLDITDVTDGVESGTQRATLTLTDTLPYQELSEQ